MHCKDCKHWQECGDPEESRIMKGSRLIGAGICLRIKPFFESEEWERIDTGELIDGWLDVMHEVRISDASGDKAWAQDGEDYAAGLITLPDFGCVMFEKKE